MIGNTGMFSAMLTEESKTHIYKEYEKYLMAKEAAEKAMPFITGTGEVDWV